MNNISKEFTFIDLFAGIGGLRIPFEKIGGECIFSSEIDRFARQTYSANFPYDEHQICHDITEFDIQNIPDHDLLVAGFPCQPFSLAGVSKKNSLGEPHGFESKTQGTLFFYIEQILNLKKPQVFILENVKNLRSHNKGNTYRVIMDTLERSGYKVFVNIIDAAHFLPQHRERIVIVGFRQDVWFNWSEFEIGLDARGSHKMRGILHPEDGSELSYEVSKSGYIYGKLGKVRKKYTLSRKLWKNLKDHSRKHRSLGHGFGYGLVTPDSVARTLSARYHKDGSEILVGRGGRRNPRRLTPRECARIMGFQDDFIIPVSDTQAYRQFGNSVAVPAFERVANIMKPYILGSIK